MPLMFMPFNIAFLYSEGFFTVLLMRRLCPLTLRWLTVSKMFFSVVKFYLCVVCCGQVTVIVNVSFFESFLLNNWLMSI